MRRARVFQREPAELGWSASVADYNWEGKAINVIAIARTDTWDEAMFLAQLLADPARYIRQAEQRAWAEGHKAGVLQEYFRIPGVRNTHREEDQSSDEVPDRVEEC